MQDGVELDAAILTIDAPKPRTMLGLLGAHTGHPSLGAKLANRPLHRLDFVDLEVALHAVLSLFPELPVQRFLRAGDISAE